MIHFAIVGCGHIAKKHAESIEATEGATLTAVCDRIPETMEYYVEKYQAKAYDDVDVLLTNPDIDVVCICTPSGLHAGLTKKVAEAKKHVVVEKPIALTLEDATDMIEACRENDVKLSVVHPNRFRPAVMKLREVMDKNLLGKLSHANATVRWNRNQAYYDQAAWRGTKAYDGGVLMNQAIHNLDLLLWMMGEPEEIFSMSATRLRNIEAEDVSTGVVRFKNGALGVVEAAVTLYPENLEESLSVFGESGTVKISGKTANFIEHWKLEGTSEAEAQSVKDEIKNDPFGKPGHLWIIEDMVQAIQKDREPIVSGVDGKNALALVLAFYESAEKNSPIKWGE